MAILRQVITEVNPTVTTLQIPLVDIDEFGNSTTRYVPSLVYSSFVVFPTGPTYEDYYFCPYYGEEG